MISDIREFSEFRCYKRRMVEWSHEIIEDYSIDWKAWCAWFQKKIEKDHHGRPTTFLMADTLCGGYVIMLPTSHSSNQTSCGNNEARMINTSKIVGLGVWLVVEVILLIWHFISYLRK